MFNGFTDIHCHVIPDVDDGCKGFDKALMLLEKAYLEGIRRVICTPHFGALNQEYDLVKVRNNFNTLKEMVKEKYPDMSMYMGNEIYLSPGYPDGLKDNMSCTLAESRFVLIEFPMDIEYEYIVSSCKRLSEEGYFPVLAHAERYMHIVKGLKGYMTLSELGMFFQVNSNTIANMEIKRNISSLFNRKSRGDKILRDMLENNLITFIATDCHDMPGRHPKMIKAAENLELLCGREKADRILYENPDMIFW